MTLLIADDHATVRAGIRALLLAAWNLNVTAIEEVSSLEQLTTALETRETDLLVLDLQLRDGNALDAMKELCLRFPRLPILIHSLHQEGVLVVRALAWGARGFVNKQSPETVLPEAVAAVHRGEVYLDKISLSRLADALAQLPLDSLTSQGGVPGLTYREREVYKHLAAGENTKTIANALKISTKTVDNHRAAVMSKLGFTNSFDLIRHAQENSFPGP